MTVSFSARALRQLRYIHAYIGKDNPRAPGASWQYDWLTTNDKVIKKNMKNTLLSQINYSPQ
jgi:hypothetical protein